MSKKRKRISRRRLAGQRVMAHVPIYHIETGKHKPVTAARRFIAENALSAPSVFNVRRNEHTTDRFFWGEKGLFSAQYAEENHFLFPSLKVSSPNRRWYPLQENEILLGVLRVETDLKGGNWPVSLDSRLKALSISLAKCVSIELERQNKNEEVNYLKNQVNVIIHQLRNPLAAIRTYAKLLMRLALFIFNNLISVIFEFT